MPQALQQRDMGRCNSLAAAPIREGQGCFGPATYWAPPRKVGGPPRNLLTLHRPLSIVFLPEILFCTHVLAHSGNVCACAVG